MDQIKKYSQELFEDIKRIDENGREFWFARELQGILAYAKWENFKNVINKAIISLKTEGSRKNDWILEVKKPIATEKGKEKFILDYKLSRYACYIIIQNGDPRKESIAFGQKYFALQAIKKEFAEQEYVFLNEDEKNFYKKLYNGETVSDIVKRKELRHKEDMLIRQKLKIFFE